MLYSFFFAPFVEFEFMRRALLGCVVMALSSGVMGVFLMLRRMSLTGDALAHAILPGAAAGYLLYGLSLPAMTIGGLVAGAVVAMLAGLVARTTTLHEDTSFAAFYLLSLALGVTLVSLKGSNLDLLHVLFGSVLALDNPTLYLLAGTTTLTLVVMAIMSRALVLESVDPAFLQALGTRSGAYAHLMFLGLMVVNLVAGFHALGTLLAVGLMMLPAASARLWCHDLMPLIGLSTLMGLISGYTGLVFSYHYNLPAGPSIILSAGVIYVLSLLIGAQGGVATRLFMRKHMAN
jgi:zinc/manganese transport system permease protein